jgi:predicted Fe-Mo cluster-binding NifX family protein
MPKLWQTIDARRRLSPSIIFTKKRGEKIMMKVAVPTRAGLVDDHFGHCEAYTIFNIGENKTIESTEMLPSPQGCGCKSDIVLVLKELGVTVMLAGNMGNGALKVLTTNGIQTFRGCTGDVRKVVETYLKGFVFDSGEACDHHEEGHECSH